MPAKLLGPVLVLGSWDGGAAGQLQTIRPSSMALAASLPALERAGVLAVFGAELERASRLVALRRRPEPASLRRSLGPYLSQPRLGRVQPRRPQRPIALRQVPVQAPLRQALGFAVLRLVLE